MKHGVLFLLAIIVGLGVSIDKNIGGGLAIAATHSRKVCTTNPPAGTARCHAIILTGNDSVTPMTSAGPQGYGPSTFKAAYGVHGNSTAHIAVIDAYDAPTITNDLANFSKAYGLPVLPACTSMSQGSCFEKLSQTGSNRYPATNSSWAVETSLDVESAHGMCPGCRISLIEAASASMSNLTAALDTAIAGGARVVSNSYGGPESASEAVYDRHYAKPGVSLVVSSGDNGYGVNYPAASPNVVAVGGTTLKMSGSRVAGETVWDGAGSGCSQFEPKPAWQHDKKCAARSIADVAADADPNTGAAIYDSYPTGGRSGWFTVGGTSLAAPLVAGIIATSGTIGAQPAYLYNNAANVIRDITTGSNGSCAIYLCKATAGYDGPTGLGVLSRL
jgi:subtilase family serine protease